ncbi:hypothetical protein [Paenibacillus humicola]|uniref:hypothetical protein n=1 Tax=Paenibacillus humicola TaxID=3110540 RepID=UPI00237A482C|nr:hypothetical protein [Paenibacillus humicola]
MRSPFPLRRDEGRGRRRFASSAECLKKEDRLAAALFFGGILELGIGCAKLFDEAV